MKTSHSISKFSAGNDGTNSSNVVVATRDRSSSRMTPARWLRWWVVVLCGVTCMSLAAVYVSYVGPCEINGSEFTAFCRMPLRGAGSGTFSRPTKSRRIYTDEEITSRAVARDLLSHRTGDSPAGSKIAFLFMTPGPLPLEMVWVDFWAGHEGLYTVYVHASEGNEGNKHGWRSSAFRSAAIPSRSVFWGRIEMVDAERRLLANALMDPANMFFVLLSESCIPLYDFDYVYAFLMGSDKSFVEAFDDPGMHGRGRYLPFMKPEIEESDWRKGAQWIAIRRAHAMLIVLDRVYYKKFKMFCKPGVEDMNFNCVADEHYIPTFLHIMDPNGIANRSITYTDWSQRGWHPREHGKDDVSPVLLMEMQSVTYYTHVTSEVPEVVVQEPCMWNGEMHACFVFARKFTEDSAPTLQNILPNLMRTSY